jgi:hypothetical protein
MPKIIPIALLILAIIGTMPVWPYSRYWSVYVPAGFGLLLVIVYLAVFLVEV